MSVQTAPGQRTPKFPLQARPTAGTCGKYQGFPGKCKNLAVMTNLICSAHTRIAAPVVCIALMSAVLNAAPITLMSGLSSATSIIWDDDDTTNNWSVGANWTGTPDNTVPGSGDTAEFAHSGSGSHQATLDSNQTINGLIFNGDTGNFTIADAGTNTLTLGNGGITTGGTGNTFTVGVDELLRTTTTHWTAGTGDTLVINSSVTSNGGFDNLTLDGAGTIEFTGVIDITSKTVVADGVTIANGATFDNRGTFTVQDGAEFRVTGNAALKRNGAEGFTAIVEGGGLVTLETDSSRVDTWTMKGGELNIQSGAVFGDWPGLDNTMMEYTAGSGEQARVTGSGSLDAGRLTRRIVVADDPSLDIDMRIDVPLVNLDGRSGSFEKDGDGTLAFNGNNTYNNPVRINAGTLLINGSTSGQGSYTVTDGATLGGTGMIGLASGENVTVNGTLAPGGASTGTLAVDGDVFFGGASTGELLTEVVGTDHDVLEINGNLNLVNATLSLLDSGTTGPGTIMEIVTYDSLTGTFGNVSDGDVIGNYIFNYGSNAITLTTIPEPGTFFSTLAIGIVAMLGRHCRAVGRGRVLVGDEADSPASVWAQASFYTNRPGSGKAPNPRRIPDFDPPSVPSASGILKKPLPRCAQTFPHAFYFAECHPETS